MMEGMEAFNTRMFEVKGQTVVLEAERQQLINVVTVLRGQGGQRQPAAAGVPASSTPTIDTKVLGKSDHCNGDPTRFGDWSFKIKSYMDALGSGYQQLFAEAEQSAVPILNATRDSTEATLNAQPYFVLVMLSTDTALDKCHNAGINEGLKTWRQFTVGWEPNLMSRYVGLLLQIPSFQFDGDMSGKLSSFERQVRGYEFRSRKAVDDDLKMGVVILGMQDSRHLICNTARLDTWIKTELLEITRTQQYIDAQPAPMQLGATPKGKGKAEGKAKASPPPPSRQAEPRPPKTKKKPRALRRRKNASTVRRKGMCERIARKRQKVLALAEGRPVIAGTTADSGQPVSRTRPSLALCHESANPHR